jgi:UDP-glucose 4-epimerase
MNILVIGGNGFIGSHLVDYLLLNKYKVRVFDSTPERFRKPLKKVDYRLSDINNIPDLYEALLGIDIVFHLASSIVPSSSNVNIISSIKKNILPTIQLLDLIVHLKIPKIIYFSSGGAVYGIPEKTPIPETHKLEPISSYGIIKATIENYIRLYNSQFGLDYLIVRPSNPYGPRQGHFLAQGIISTFLRKVHNKEILQIFGDGSTTKDYIYITDLIELTFDCFKKNISGTFNIGSGVGTSINQIIDVIEKVTKRKNKISHTQPKSYDVKNFILDIKKIASHTTLNLKLTPLEKGVQTTNDWLKNNIFMNE